jgi:hypothetical protein
MRVPRAVQVRVLGIVRARILAAVVDYYDFDPTDDIAMTEPQELTDHIMAGLFRRTRGPAVPDDLHGNG